MVDFSALADTAQRLLSSNGQTLIFTRQIVASSDPVTGINSYALSNYSGKGAGFDYINSEIDGEVIKKGDVRIVLESVDTKPLQNDKVTYNGSVYRVMNIEEVSPSGVVVIYKLQVRK